MKLARALPILIAILISGCQGLSLSQESLNATKTQIASNIFLTQTAQAPTETSIPASHPTPIYTSTVTATPKPKALVHAETVTLYEGPGMDYPEVGQVEEGTELEIEGKTEGCLWLRVHTMEDMEGWVLGHIAYVGLNCACESLPGATYRPLNGTLILDCRDAFGGGNFTVENGLTSDSVVVLASAEGSPVVAFFVRAEEAFTLTHVPDGAYQIYCATGEVWDGIQRQFTLDLTTQRFEEWIEFQTHGNQYTVWTVTLHPVAEGEAHVVSVDPEAFPDLK